MRSIHPHKCHCGTSGEEAAVWCRRYGVVLVPAPAPDGGGATGCHEGERQDQCGRGGAIHAAVDGRVLRDKACPRAALVERE